MIFFGIVAIIFIKKRKNSNIKTMALNPIYEKNVTFLHKTFLPEFVKDWSDIEIVNSIGEGNFGKVYKGFLSLDPIARYSHREKHSVFASRFPSFMGTYLCNFKNPMVH